MPEALAPEALAPEALAPEALAPEVPTFEFPAPEVAAPVSATAECGTEPEPTGERAPRAEPERAEREGPPPAEWEPLAHGGAAGWRTVLGVLLVLGGVLGAMLLVLAMMRAPTPPPQPTAAQAPPSSVVAPTATAPPSPAPAAAASLPPSAPVRIDVDRARIHAPIIATGLDADDTVAVPPIDHPYLTGWYDRSVAPGQEGAAVLLGHVDSRRTGPAVFYYLGTLTRGDTIEITRADHRVAVFTVDGVAGYPKTEFPATAVYGPTTGARLRLVTCGGAFDERSHSYERNVVVFASLSSSHPETAAEAARPLVTRPPS
ncbi:class F sortase [Actinocatenispora sera]|uniref:class F sortase n=1 Tax=Actinocatenispora sera TaxID=390989 RepID=UPI0033C5C31F